MTEHPETPPAAPAKKGLGITAMVLGIIAVVIAFIPVLGVGGFILGLVAVVLGIVAVIKRKGRGQGIAGIITGVLSLIIAGIVTALTGLFVSAVDEEIQNSENELDSSVEETEGASEETAAEDDASSESAGSGGSDGSGDAGSRENPLALGETASAGDWEITINDVIFDADEQIAAENQFNEEAPEGSSYALIDTTVTYTGDESESIVMGVSVDYVADSGETLSWTDSMATAPNELDISQELYNGGSAQGNVVIAVPDEGDGLVRARIGMIDTTDVFFETE
ncbi:DUF4190 domain-containing protein [Nesterenkonia halobia]|uniref:DUF4190 domain-containing protein n=1 Tax=Nesterenkonia halobia TaxID=37922 RepID=A0ABP6RG30_9MICC